MSIKTHFFFTAFFFLFFSFLSKDLFAQAELEPWGNIEGIRIDGQLIPINSNLSVVKNNGSQIYFTAHERQRPDYKRNGKSQIVATNIDSLYFKERLNDAGKGVAEISVKVNAHANESMDGVFFTLFLNDADYENAAFKVDNSKEVKFSSPQNDIKNYLLQKGKFFQFVSYKNQLRLSFARVISLSIKRRENGWQIFIPIKKGSMRSGEIAHLDLTIKVSGIIDHSLVKFQLDTSNQGRSFDGMGGNFRLQNPKVDPEVIDYCLKNLDVRWARVELPWRQWQPQLDQDPVAEANAGKLDPHVKASMEMAARLAKMGIPVILSAWFPPDWAVVGKVNFRPVNGVWGNQLDHSKDQQIYKSIADYITYLKENYGADIKLFSFNESDLGINVRQTADEHDELIKGLGAYFESRGLKTKMLLGDNSDATTWKFIEPAMNDTTTHRFIGAVSFHSWRGWENATLQKWADAATLLKRPLIVAEGSIDAQAWGYPQIFLEPMYALNEINLYVRLLSICQPEAILQWQLTSDYSLLAGGGIFGDTSKLRPTQRFWNFKQISSTPEGLKAMKLETSGNNISATALGDNQKKKYAIHIVNNGASKPGVINGLPSSVKYLRIFVTDATHDMKEGKQIVVKNGTAKIILGKTSFTSLFSE